MAEILRALDLLHFRGIVHGDLKAANILILPGGGLRLIDLDWSYRAHAHPGRRSGTAGLMPPEVIRGTRPDGRSDLYSLGILLKSLMSGAEVQRWAHWIESLTRSDPLERPESALAAHRAAPWLAPLPFFDSNSLRCRYRLPAESQEKVSVLIATISHLTPSPGGFIERTLGAMPLEKARTIWEALVGHPFIVERMNQGLALTESALEQIQLVADPAPSQAGRHKELALLDAAYDEGRFEEVLSGAARVIEEGNARILGATANLAGLAAWSLGRWDVARDWLEKARSFHLQHGDWGGAAKALNNLAMLNQRQGQSEAARQLYLAGLELARQSSNRESIAGFLFNLGVIHQEEGRVGDALNYFEEAQQAYAGLGDAARCADCAYNRALLLGYCGRGEAALALLAVVDSPAISGASLYLIRLLRCELLLDFGKIDEALAAWTSAERCRTPLAPAHEDMPEILQLRLAADESSGMATSASEPPDAATEWNSEKVDAHPELAFWTASWHWNRGNSRLAFDLLSRHSGRPLPHASLLGVRTALLLVEIATAHPRWEPSDIARSRLRRAVEEWQQRVPVQWQRDLAAHPLHQEAVSRMQAASESTDARPGETGGRVALDMVRAIARLGEAPNAAMLTNWALETLVEVSGAQRGFVVLREEGGERVAAALRFNREAVDNPAFEISRTLLRQAMDRGEVVNASNAQEEEGAGRSVFDLNLRSVLILPLIHEGAVVGAAYLDHAWREGAFAGAETGMLRIVADQIAAALVRQRLSTELAGKAAALEEANRQLASQVRKKSREARQLEVRLAEAQRHLEERFDFARIVGQNPAMKRIFHQVERVRDSLLPILIAGESGSGKELVARAIHYTGERATGPFVALNCSAFPDALVEAELFGHVRGAFTGADRDRPGAFVEASGGTLMLDEIGAMGLGQQARLLRVLQEGEVRPLGSDRTMPVDVRVVSATNEDLARAVKEGRFREDLYYRLNGLTVHLPPLRERREDIPLLIEHFRLQWEREQDRKASFTSVQLRRWMAYHWPGNVRELQNLLHRYFLLGEDPLDSLLEQSARSEGWSKDHPFDLSHFAPLDERKNGMAEAKLAFERALMEEALRRAGGVKAKAARLLGIPPQRFNHFERKLAQWQKPK